MNASATAFLQLRILVLTLGEAHHAGWWKSQFLSAVGLSFLERIYPRSTFSAAVRSASRAALSVHDASVGKGGVFHLFRLPRHTEREIERALAERSDELAGSFRPMLTDEGELLDRLDALSDHSSVSSSVGPIELSVQVKEFVPTMAAIYLTAFQQGTQAFPYFEEDERGS